MQFKNWLLLTEAIDELTKGALEKFIAPPEELRAFIKELQDNPEQIDRKKAFQLINQKFNVQKKEVKPKESDAQLKHFQSVPGTTPEELEAYKFYKNQDKNSLTEMMKLLRDFLSKNIIELKIENNKPVLYKDNQKVETPDFTRFLSTLHGLEGEIKQYSSKGMANPLELSLSHAPNLVAFGDKVWVFKGERPNICRILGKNQRWCIASSSSAANWFDYRVNHGQTQYFVFDFNKSEDDPARYVNPGVAPEGEYSEWVDAKNNHSTDPEDPNSEVGINGYSSINQYKKYLASKGIPLDIWQTDQLEDWEKRLARYYRDDSFYDAKKDKNPEVFPLYLKIVNQLEDEEFETLSSEQKADFLSGKLIDLTKKQLDYAMKNLKSEYINSLNAENKVIFASETGDYEFLSKVIKNNDIKSGSIRDALAVAKNKQKVCQVIIDNMKEIPEDAISLLLRLSGDPLKALKEVMDKNPNLPVESIDDVLYTGPENRKEIIDYIIKHHPKISSQIIYLLFHFSEPENYMHVKNLLGRENMNKLESDHIATMLRSYENPEHLADILGSEIINKIGKDEIITSLMGKNGAKIARMLGPEKLELLSDEQMLYVIRHAYSAYEMAKVILDLKKNISGDYVLAMMDNADDISDMAKLLGPERLKMLSDDDLNKIKRNRGSIRADKMRQVLSDYGILKN